jgi:hypothetical protein
LDDANVKAMKSQKLQHLITYCKTYNIDLVAITNSPPEKIQHFVEKYHITFPIYYNPIDPVKGPFMVRDAIRSNPGLIILEKGVVTSKKPWRRF